MNSFNPEEYRKQTKILIILGVTLIIAFFLDSLFVTIFSNLQNSFLDFIFTYLTDYILVVIIALVLPTVWLWFDHEEKKIIPLWTSFIGTGIIAYSIKILVQRPRPTDTNIFLATTNSSFPSLHTATAFSVIALLSIMYPKYAKYFIAFAVVVAITRMYFGLHFLSDIIAGVTLGYFMGYGVMYLHTKRRLF
jgi:undecaprenyl-diphosphatase